MTLRRSLAVSALFVLTLAAGSVGAVFALDCGLMPEARADCAAGDALACEFVSDHPIVDAFVSR